MVLIQLTGHNTFVASNFGPTADPFSACSPSPSPRRWSSIPDGVVRDNCYNNTETIDVSLKLFAFPTDTPLYVASYWDDVDPDRAKTVGRLGWLLQLLLRVT